MDITPDTVVKIISVQSPEYLKIKEEQDRIKLEMRRLKARFFQLSKLSKTQYRLDQQKSKLLHMD